MGFHRQRTMWLWRNPDNVTHRQLLSIDQVWWGSTALTWSRWGCHRLADNIWLLAHDNNNNTDDIDQWVLLSNVKGLCFDTIALNTDAKGVDEVSCWNQLEVLHSVCRHHASEIMLEKIFTSCDVLKSPVWNSSVTLEIFSLIFFKIVSVHHDKVLAAIIAAWMVDDMSFHWLSLRHSNYLMINVNFSRYQISWYQMVT